MPSVLIETGFISNPEDEKYLNSENGQKELAECITRAVKTYVAWLEKQQSSLEDANAGKQSIPSGAQDTKNFLEAIDRKEKETKGR
jgi:N-acetylmuramoyl-L-alanine amidase